MPLNLDTSTVRACGCLLATVIAVGYAETASAQLTPRVTFGSGLFGDLQAATAARWGEFVALDAQAREVLRFDLSGQLIGRFGRQGEGPGEFRSRPSAIASYDEGLLVTSGRLIIRFTRDGEFVDQIEPPSRASYGWTIGVASVADTTWAVFRDLNADLEVFRFVDGEWTRVAEGPYTLNRPFAQRAAWGASRASGFLVSFKGESIERLSFPERGIENPEWRDRREYSRSVHRPWADEYERLCLGSAVEDRCRGPMENLISVAEDELGQMMAPIGSMAVDQDGSIAVSRTDLSSNPFDEFSDRVDLIYPDGRQQSLTLDREASLLAYHDGIIWTAFLGNFGEQLVAGYAVPSNR